MQHLITGVSATALTVAAARAIATADGRIDDPFAALFIAASGHDELPVRLADASDESRAFWEQISGYLAARTRAFDAWLLEAAEAGVHQVVLVAAGLDARACRLPWPDGVTVFEIDREPVLAFKQSVLDAEASAATARRVPIASDVAHDWRSALDAAGFDADAPTAWLVEGLLPYLPAELETSLIQGIGDASAPGSTLALEFIRRPDAPLGSGSAQIAALFDAGPRPRTLEALRGSGWQVGTEDVGELVTWAFARR